MASSQNSRARSPSGARARSRRRRASSQIFQLQNHNPGAAGSQAGTTFGRGGLGGGARHGYKVRRNSSVAPDSTTTEVNASAKISVVTAVMPTSLSSSVRKPWTA